VWTQTVTHLAEEQAATSGVDQIAAIGIGLGGLLALHASDLGAPIDQVALWGVPPSGGRLIREFRAAAALIPPPVGAATVAGADSRLELTGYVLTEATSAGLRTIDLSEGRISAPRRVLLLARDGIAVDPTFIERLRVAGAEVTLGDGMGFGPMMADPEKSRVPEETIAVSAEWLAADPARRLPPIVIPETSMGRGEPLVACVGAHLVAEHAVVVPTPDGELFGVLCIPATDGPASWDLHASAAAVLLNGAAQRHTGQNRNWVETARRWAARGVPSLRIDLPDIGDAGGMPSGPVPLAEFYDKAKRINQIRASLTWLRSEGIADRFLLAGLCAGAYGAYHAALADRSVVAIGLINLPTFAWSPTLDEERGRRATIRALRGDVAGKLRSDKQRRAAIARSLRMLGNVPALAQARRGQQQHADRVGAELAGLDARGCEVHFLVGRNEGIKEELRSFHILERLGKWSRIRVEEFDWDDHAVRALASQQIVAAWLDGLLERITMVDPQSGEVAVTPMGSIDGEMGTTAARTGSRSAPTDQTRGHTIRTMLKFSFWRPLQDS
jgi:dienelactone hydrolase